jgi:hypothetical protein
MVNFGLNSASILGIFLAVAGASLYFLRSVRPELSRDQDIFFAAVGLLCGFILLFQGWRLDPILQFGQFLLTGATVFFAAETIRLRGLTTEQAKRSSKIVDENRPVSNAYQYQAELEQIEPYEEDDRYDNPRLQGYRDRNTSRKTSAYDSESPRVRRSRSSSGSDRDRYTPSSSSSSKRRPRPGTPTPPPTSSYEDRYGQYDRMDSYDSWTETQDTWDESAPTTSRPRRPRPNNGAADTPYRSPKKRRPSPSDTERDSVEDIETTPTDYVDYQPIDRSESEDFDRERDWKRGKDPESNREEDKPTNFDY